MNLKTAVSHRGTETTEAAAKQLRLRKALRNHYAQARIKHLTSWRFFHWLCVLCDSVAISTAGFGMIDLPPRSKALGFHSFQLV